jgi:hypothetical protein
MNPEPDVPRFQTRAVVALLIFAISALVLVFGSPAAAAAVPATLMMIARLIIALTSRYSGSHKP